MLPWWFLSCCVYKGESRFLWNPRTSRSRRSECQAALTGRDCTVVTMMSTYRWDIRSKHALRTRKLATGHFRHVLGQCPIEVIQNFLMGVFRVALTGVKKISTTPPTIIIFEKQRIISWLWHHVCRALCWTFTITSTCLVDVWLSRQEVEIVMPGLAILSGVRMRGIKDPLCCELPV